MPQFFEAIDIILTDYLLVDETVAAVITSVLEYAAVAELLNAAQQALAPSKKNGIGAGLFIGEEENATQ